MTPIQNAQKCAFTNVVRAETADSGGSMNAKSHYNHVLNERHMKRLSGSLELEQ